METYPTDAPPDRFDHLPQKTFKVTISPYSPATSWFSVVVVIFLFLVIPNLLVLFIPFLIGLAVLAVNRIKRITHLEVSTGPEGIAFKVIPEHDKLFDYLKKYFPEKRWSFFKWLSEKVGVSFPQL